MKKKQTVDALFLKIILTPEQQIFWSFEVCYMTISHEFT